MNLRGLVFVVLILVSGIFYYNYVSSSELLAVDVVRVVDGDTVELEGAKVRLIGINTPEKNMPLYEEARSFLEGLLVNQSVKLERVDVDRYGRVLGYLFVGEQNINLEILKNGYAHLYYYDKDKYYRDMSGAEEFAREHELGLWKRSNYSNCFSLVRLDYYDEEGEVETLELENDCGDEVDVIIKDDATHIYEEEIGDGSWNRNFENIFNDDGDSLYVWDSDGGLILFYRYA